MSADARIAIGLPAHPKTKKLIRRLGDGAAWRLVCLFLWAASNRSDGDLTGLTDEDIELAVDWTGAEGEFASALVEVGFLENGKLDASLWEASDPVMARFGRICSKKWAVIRQKVFSRDGFICQYCLSSDGPFECDHIVPIAKGGSNDLANLATACRRCNRSKRDKLVSAWRNA